MQPREIIECYLPYLVLAGDYALRIQSHVRSAGEKDTYTTATAQALTDADLTIQSLFELVTLSQLPGVEFFGEEVAKSLNDKYFPTDTEYTVTLDPINGTLAYQDGLPIFDIIIGVLCKGQIVAAVTYLPSYQRCYLAIAGEGAFTATREEMQSGLPSWTPYKIDPASNNRLMTYRADQLTLESVRKKFSVVQMDKEYDPATWDAPFCAVLTGTTDGYFRISAPLIDWATVGFIVHESGGVMSDFDGNPIPPFANPQARCPSILVCSSKAVHERLISTLVI